MKSRETAIRLQRFEVSERRQKLADIEMMIADFKRMANDLEHQIKVEQETSGIKDEKHFAYPTFAKAAARRRDNLLSSIQGLEKKLTEARAEVEEAVEELRKIEMAEERETGRAEDAAPEPLTPPPAPKGSPASKSALASQALSGATPSKRPDTSARSEPSARLESQRQRKPRERGGAFRVIGGGA
jgi:flagellar FliJ protein